MLDCPTSYGHTPVLQERCCQLLAPALTPPPHEHSRVIAIDATVGAGGHAHALLTQFPHLELIAFDHDPAALQIAQKRLKPFENRTTFIHDRYDTIQTVLEHYGLAHPPQISAVLLDLGVSSMQLDQPQRGFSYSHDGPLDMRMNPHTDLTAAMILNSYDRETLTEIFHRYGEEKFARRIAEEIVTRRHRAPFQTTGQLTQLLYEVIPAPARRRGGHPAKRIFQALRIEVNDELTCLQQGLPQALSCLRPGGRIVVLAYQSLEDRIVKRLFRTATSSQTPLELPIELPQDQPTFIPLTKGAEQAPLEEKTLNRRATPVRLRALEKTHPSPTCRGGHH